MPLLLLVVLQALELQLVVRFAASLAVDRLRGAEVLREVLREVGGEERQPR